MLFDQWFYRRFSSPIDIISNYISEIHDAAGLVNASLPHNFLSALPLSNKSKGARQYIYLPNKAAMNDQKQGCFAFLGEMNISGQNLTLEIPVIGFQSFKQAEIEYWSPAKSLWRDFARAKSPSSNHSHNADEARKAAESKYQQEVLLLQQKIAKSSVEMAEASIKAHKAAAALAELQLTRCLVATVNDPYKWFGLKGLNARKFAEYECVQSAFAEVFLTKTRTWEIRAAAQPTDMLVPMYGKSGKLVNFQAIKPRGKGKTFIPGSQTIGSFAIVSESINPNHFIISEGYKTSRVCDHANDLHDYKVTNVCAFSASNLYHVAMILSSLYPDAIIQFAVDNDPTSYSFANKAIAERPNMNIIPAPQLFKSSDWADLAKDISVDEAAKAFFVAFSAALN